MQIVTSWMEEGIEQGIEQGKLSMLMRLLSHRVGELTAELADQVKKLSSSQVDDLSIALLDFKDMADLQTWLSSK